MAERRFMRVRGDMPPGHLRTPAYLRGKTGWVERDLGPFPNPEQLAYRHAGAPTDLMRIRFTMAEIWGPTCEGPADTLDAEIYTHWLEPAEAPYAP